MKGQNPRYKQGQFIPRYPEKYKGDFTKIVYRSGLELKYFQHLDTRSNVIEWASEEFYIPYTAPDGTNHKYYIDVWVKVKTKDGSIKQFIAEIKPYSQTHEPKAMKRITKAYKNKIATYLVNKCKWDAAEKFAEKNKMKFIILTEKDIK